VNERLREALRRKIAAFNRFTGIVAVSSTAAVLLLWGAIYFSGRWLLTLLSTIIKGIEGTEPSHYDRWFWPIFALWLLAGGIAWRTSFWRVREEKSVLHVLAELVLLPTRATFGALESWGRRIFLDENQLIQATDFLVKVVRAGKFAEDSVPAELPEEKNRARVLRALQVLDLIYRRETKEQGWYAVANPQRLLAFLPPAG